MPHGGLLGWQVLGTCGRLALASCPRRPGAQSPATHGFPFLGPLGAEEDLAELHGSRTAPPPCGVPLEMRTWPWSPASFGALPSLGTPAAAAAGQGRSARIPALRGANGAASEPSGRRDLGQMVRRQHTPQPPPPQPSLGSEGDNLLLIREEGAASGTKIQKPGVQLMA